jgi:hypothetical protein
MKFVLFVEGHTEKRGVPAFLKRWLDPRLPQPVGIKPVRFEGWRHYQSEIVKKVQLNLSGESNKDVIAAFGLLDLYGPSFYPQDRRTTRERLEWAKSHFECLVGESRFSQHFAVHEIEAWILSDVGIFPREVREKLPATTSRPESINSNEPPARLLDRLYSAVKGRGYRKVIDGTNLLSRLDPAIAYEKCPALKALLDDMLSRARSALEPRQV